MLQTWFMPPIYLTLNLPGLFIVTSLSFMETISYPKQMVLHHQQAEFVCSEILIAEWDPSRRRPGQFSPSWERWGELSSREFCCTGLQVSTWSLDLSLAAPLIQGPADFTWAISSLVGNHLRHFFFCWILFWISAIAILQPFVRYWIGFCPTLMPVSWLCHSHSFLTRSDDSTDFHFQLHRLIWVLPFLMGRAVFISLLFLPILSPSQFVDSEGCLKNSSCVTHSRNC